MALTRKLLKGLGLSDEQIETIIDAHTETVDGLKDERDGYKADAEKLPGVQKELDDLKKNGGDWQKKYEDEKTAHDNLKKEISEKETKTQKIAAFRQLLKDENVSEKRIETVIKASASVIEAMELDKDGKPTKADELKKGIKDEWSDFITTTTTTGATVAHPPANTGGSSKTKAEILAMTDGAARRQAMLENPSLFPELAAAK